MLPERQRRCGPAQQRRAARRVEFFRVDRCPDLLGLPTFHARVGAP